MTMARGRARNQKGTLILTPTGSWKICYYVYLTDPIMKQEKRHHRTRVIGHKSSIRNVDEEQILRQELDLAAKPSSRPADHTITFGEWMRTVYIPLRGANWRPATQPITAWSPLPRSSKMQSSLGVNRPQIRIPEPSFFQLKRERNF